MYFITVKVSFLNSSINNIIISFTFISFTYGTFLEIVQIPICLIALFFKYCPIRIWLMFLQMFIFFTIKIILFMYLLGTGL